jgi:hypothetical protein
MGSKDFTLVQNNLAKSIHLLHLLSYKNRCSSLHKDVDYLNFKLDKGLSLHLRILS